LGNLKFLIAFVLSFAFSINGFAQISKELLSNGGFESGVAKWKAYCDAAGTSPVDGVGGGGSGLTITASTTSPIAGKSSGVITKDAANRQGCGVATDFVIDSEFKAKVLQISLKYTVSSGTYADDQFKVYVYDIDNAAMIEAAPTAIKNVSGIEEFNSSFQTSLTGVNYRLIIHNSTTSASSSTVKIEASVSSKTYSVGAFATDWVTYTPTVTGFGTLASQQFQSRRVGDSLEVRGVLVTGTPTGSTASVTLGFNGSNNNVTADTAKIGGGGYSNNTSIGTAWTQNNSSTYFGVEPVLVSNTIQFGIQASTANPTSTAAGSGMIGSAATVSFSISVPIVGWSSNVQMSTDTDTRVVATRLAGSSTTINNTTPSLVWPAATYDTHGSFDGTSTWTCKVPGFYKISMSARVTSASYATGQILEIYYNKSGTGNVFLSRTMGNGTSANYSVTGSDTLNLVAGDTLVFKAYSDVSNTFDNSRVTIERQSGPSVIAASESVSARYFGNDAPSLSGTFVIFKGTTKDWDSHGIINGTTGVITIPVSGTYLIEASVGTGSLSTAANQYLQVEVRTGTVANSGTTKDGTTHRVSSGVYATHVPVRSYVKALAGDTFTVQVASDMGASRSLQGNFIAVTRVGNY